MLRPCKETFSWVSTPVGWGGILFALPPLLQLWLPKLPCTTLYIQHISTLCPCSIHLNQFSHPENGGSMFAWNVRTFNHNTLQKCTRLLSFGQQLLWKCDSFYKQIPSLCNNLFWPTCVVEQKYYSILFHSVWNCRINSLNPLLCTFWQQLILYCRLWMLPCPSHFIIQ